MAFDKGENGGLTETVSIPTVRRSSEGPGEEKVQVVSAPARTPLEGRDFIDQAISDSFDPAKLRVLLVGEELAKENIYALLDEFYRNPTNNLNSKIALTRGEASELIQYRNDDVSRISDYISGILEGAEAATHTTGENIQLICAELYEPGEDFSLPILYLNKDRNVIQFDGMGLFHDSYYTGVDITPIQSTVYMLLQGIKGKEAMLTRKVFDKFEVDLYNYVTVNIMRLKRDTEIKVEDDTVTVDLKVSLDARVVELPSDHLHEKGTVEKLNEKLSEILTKDAEGIIAKMQEANSDVLAIGRQVKAYHPEVYKKLDWKETYPEIVIKPKVELEILQHGIIY